MLKYTQNQILKFSDEELRRMKGRYVIIKEIDKITQVKGVITGFSTQSDTLYPSPPLQNYITGFILDSNDYNICFNGIEYILII